MPHRVEHKGRSGSSWFFLTAAVFCLLFIATPLRAGVFEKVQIRVPGRFRTRPFRIKRYLNVPPGFRVNVFAAGFLGPRFMSLGPDGVIYLTVPREGKVVALPDRDGDGVADDVITFAEGLDSPHGITFTEKGMVVAEAGRLTLLRDENGDMKADSRKVLTTDIPYGGGHWTRTVEAGPDGALYVSAGSSCNVCIEKDRRRAAVLRFSGDMKKAEIWARGLRNSVGIAFDPETGKLWGVDNGRDWLGDDLPPEELNLIERGGDYGWPFCYGERVPDPEFGSKERCGKTKPPVVEMQAHTAPLGIAFATEKLKFPDRYKKGLFIAMHGSWNRKEPVGYKLVFLPFKNGRPASRRPEDFISGWLFDYHAWGRPVFPLIGPDGALYLTDDEMGAVYRIFYTGKTPSADSK